MADVVVHPPYEWIEEQFFQCPSFRERHGWISDERRKALIMEFFTKLTVNDWAQLAQVVGKIAYISDVQATPIKESKLPWRGWYRYEVAARLDTMDDNPCIVLDIEHTFRNKIFGVGLREIWIPLAVVTAVLSKLFPEKYDALSAPHTLAMVLEVANAQPSDGLKLDRPAFWLSDKPFAPVEMWEDTDEEDTGSKGV